MKQLSKIFNESVWGKILDRGAGETIRKEDDINLLDRDELFDYIFDLYEQVEKFPMSLKSSTSQTHTYFTIPIFQVDLRIHRLNVSFENNIIKSITILTNDCDVKDFKQALIDNFDVTIRVDGTLKITDKDGKVSNQVCMDLIKTIVENAPVPYLKKREN